MTMICEGHDRAAVPLGVLVRSPRVSANAVSAIPHGLSCPVDAVFADQAVDLLRAVPVSPGRAEGEVVGGGIARLRDLVSTCPAADDLLATPGQLRVWLSLQADRFAEALELLTAADLAAVRELREHTAQVLDHIRSGTQPPAAALHALNEAQRTAPAVSELTWNDGAVTVTRRREGTPGAQLMSWLAEAAARLLADPAVAKVRECEADGVMLFLPSHPRCRWCSAARCGNRVRVARHYQRRKHT